MVLGRDSATLKRGLALVVNGLAPNGNDAFARSAADVRDPGILIDAYGVRPGVPGPHTVATVQ